MSRTPDVLSYRSVRYEIPDDLKAEREKYSATPNIKGLDDAAARICELFGYRTGDVTRAFIKFHTERTKKLAYHKIGGNRYYSDRDLFDLMHFGTRPTPDEKATA